MRISFVFLLIIVFLSPSCQKGDHSEEKNLSTYYWYQGEKQPLQLKSDKLFLLLEKKEVDDLVRVIKAAGDDIESIEKFRIYTLNFIEEQDESNDQYWTIVSGKGNKAYLDAKEIVYYAPFYYTMNRFEAGISHLFTVMLSSIEDFDKLERLSKQNRVNILGSNTFMPLWYTLSCDRNSKGNALEMANLFYESGLFSAAEPDLMSKGVYNKLLSER